MSARRVAAMLRVLLAEAFDVRARGWWWGVVLLAAGCDAGGGASVADAGVVDAGRPDAARPHDAALADALVDAATPDAIAHADADVDAHGLDGALARDALVVDAGPVLPTGAEALETLQAATLSLRDGWRFRPDPDDVGVREGWAASDFDDALWAPIQVGSPWEDQGFPGLDGLGWYRVEVDLPADWAGSTVRLIASGVDDAYDLFVNGQALRHYGEAPDRSVWNWRTEAEISGALRFGERNVLAFRVEDWGGGGGLWRAVTLRRSVPIRPYAHLFPRPVIDSHPEWIDLYWAAWQMHWDKVSFGTPENGLADAYLDEGFNEQIYQWDSSFMTLFARYAADVLPVMATLDNFYDRQRADGYIARVYSETDGGELQEPTAEEPVVNPPLFAWIEWSWYVFSGDDSRLARVRPVLERYWQWLYEHLRAPAGQGLYYQTELGSGMDNVPRGDAAQAGWIDMSAQQVLAARALALIADHQGDAAAATRWQTAADDLSATLDQRCWDEDSGLYYDLQRDGTRGTVKHIGAFWTLVAGVADARRAGRLRDMLANPATFARAHRFPALSADHPDYDPRGHYWRGGVWAPTNYMVIQGLKRASYFDDARAAAENHLAQVAAVYGGPPPAEERIAPEERDGLYRTIWECYAPDSTSPATRWDATWYSRQDFVGWSGLGPIAMLLEDVLGFELRGSEMRVIWRLTRTDRHGAEGLPLGEGRVSLIASARGGPGEPVEIVVEADRAFELQIERPGRPAAVLQVAPGRQTLSAP